MKCSNCYQEALFKCSCQQPYMCRFHLGEHLATLKRHNYEDLDIILEELRLSQLKLEIFKKIQKLANAETLLASTTKSLINFIEKEHIKAIKKLNNLRESNFEILKINKFCISTLQEVKKIETMELDIKTKEVVQIQIEMEKVYGID